MVDRRATTLAKTRYNRIAGIFDYMEVIVERRFRQWRKRLWTQIPPGKVLEVGVGTGKNLPYYPAGAQVTAVDLSDRMLAQARTKARRKHIAVDLLQMDAQALAFPDNYFDTAAATFVFCSVPDPIAGLRELERVVKPGGRILLLEHVRLEQPLLGKLMDWINPLVVRLVGANINRRTVDNVRYAGLKVGSVEDLTRSGLVKFIVAAPG